MSNISRFAIAFSLASFLTIGVSSTKAVQFPDGTVAFDKSPRLIDAVTTFNEIRVWGAKYYFTIELPKDIGESLQKITIQQRQGQEDIVFSIKETFAFEGKPRNKGEKLTIADVTKDDSGIITIVFSEPIAPGTTFTVGIVPLENPEYSGVYLFGVTAFPTGEKPTGLYLGAGRLQFYDGGDFIN